MSAASHWRRPCTSRSPVAVSCNIYSCTSPSGNSPSTMVDPTANARAAIMANDCQRCAPRASSLLPDLRKRRPQREDTMFDEIAARRDRGAVPRARRLTLVAQAQRADPIRIGLQPQPDRPDGARGQAGAGRPGNLARRRQCEGRTARAPGRARLLRRPGAARECARHLCQADERRQGRPADRALQHQRDRRRDAGDHPGEPHDHRHLRARRQQAVQISALFLDELAGRQPAQLFGRLLRDGGGAAAETDARRAGRRRRRILAQRARRRTRERQGDGFRDRL